MYSKNKNISLLVIEDNPGDLLLIEEYLNEKFENINLEIAKSAKEAERYLTDNQHRFHVILLDLNLPDKRGKELIQFILKSSGKIPVIILTGYSDISFSVESLSMGVLDYISKDEFSPALLHKSIIYSIERKQAALKVEESEKHYRKLFQLNPEPMFLTDIESFNILDANDVAIQHYGYSRDELLSMTIADLHLNNDFFHVEKVLTNGNKKSKTYFGVYKHKLKNGETIMVEIHSNFISQNGSETRTFLIRDITENTRFQDELLKTKTLLEQTSQVARVGGFEIDIINDKADWSAVTKEIHEVEDHFHLDMETAFSFYKEGSSRQKITKVIDKAINSGSSFDEELQIVTANGRDRWVRVIGEPRFKDGKCVRLIGTLQDIHGKKMAEESLKKRKDQFKSLIDNIRETIYRAVIDESINYLFISSHIENITGYPATDFIGIRNRSYASTIHPDDRETVIEGIKSRFKKGLNWKFEYRVLHKDESIRWVYEEGYVVKDSDGKPAYCDGFILDITERKIVEEQLRINEEAFRGSFENAAIGMILIHRDGEILKVNKTLCKITGYNYNDLVGLHIRDVTRPGKHYTNLRYVSQLFTGDIDYYHLERNYLHKNGNPIWVILSVSMVKDQNRDPLYFIVQVTDISAMKKAEFELEKLNNELEEKIEERTAQLKMVNQELESFSYSVSHDLRAPLRAIDGFSQAVMEDYHDKLDETGKNYLSRVRKASQKLSMLIDDFLNLAKVSSTPLSFTPINITKIAENIIELLKTDGAGNAEFHIQPDMVDKADAALIKIAIQNLLENAWKYSSKESLPKIEFGTKNIEGKKTYFIKDNGAGFNMKYYNKLFKPFQRLHQVKDFPGSGVGLATVKRIIDRHNGDVWGRGEIGEGATFYFTLHTKKVRTSTGNN